MLLFTILMCSCYWFRAYAIQLLSPMFIFCHGTYSSTFLLISLGIKERVLGFTLVDSKMFRSFDGTWIIRCHSRYEEFDPVTGKLVYKYNTKLTYTVYVAPKGKI